MEKNFTNATKLENSLAHKIRRQIAKGNYKKATASYNRLQNIISNNSNNVVIISLSLSLSLTHTHNRLQNSDSCIGFAGFLQLLVG